MARKVFFSFHYERDLWRVNVVRNSGMVEGLSAAGFNDQSLWEETKRRGDDAIRKLIDSGLNGSSVVISSNVERVMPRRPGEVAL